jgi:hypothetical protein
MTEAGGTKFETVFDDATASVPVGTSARMSAPHRSDAHRLTTVDSFCRSTT